MTVIVNSVLTSTDPAILLEEVTLVYANETASLTAQSPRSNN